MVVLVVVVMVGRDRDSGGNSDGSCVSGSSTVVIVVVGVVVVVVVTHAQHLREGPPLQLQSRVCVCVCVCHVSRFDYVSRYASTRMRVLEVGVVAVGSALRCRSAFIAVANTSFCTSAVAV